jgi:hypothetical protein
VSLGVGGHQEGAVRISEQIEFVDVQRGTDVVQVVGDGRGSVVGTRRAEFFMEVPSIGV